MASPRWITAAEVTQEEVADVQGPASATSGNLAVFSGTTGKVIADGGPVPGGGGISVKVIDLGLVDLTDAAINGRTTPIIEAAAGRVIKSVRFVPGGEAFGESNASLYFLTPNTGTDENLDRVGFASIEADRASAQDTLGLIDETSQTCLDGTTTGPLQILDCGPLFAVSAAGGEAIGVPIGTWAAGTVYSPYDKILDSNDHVQIILFPGTSGMSEPVWDNMGGATNDGDTVQWLDSGLVASGSVHVIAEVIEGISPMPLYPATIEFVSQPQDTVAGETMPDVTVIIKDQNGDPYQFSIVTIDLFQIGFSDMTTSTQADQETGVAEFSGIVLNTPGTYTLKAQMNPCLVADPVLSDPFDITAP